MRRLGLAAACIAVGAAVTGAAGAVVVIARPAGLAAPEAAPAATRLSSKKVVDIIPTDQPAALSGVVQPDYLLVGAGSVTSAQLHRISTLSHVHQVITADAGAVKLGGQRVNMFAVDPEQFRSWTPLGTATNGGLWTALAANKFVTSTDFANRYGLRSGLMYAVTGTNGYQLTMGGSGSLGLPGVDLLVSRTVGQRVGLVHDLVVLVNAPGANMTALGRSLRKILGHKAQVLDLHQGKITSRTATDSARPDTWLGLFQQSARRCPGLSWTVLAAIAQVESDDGQNDGPSTAGALGPMQFMPSTWAKWGIDGDDKGGANIMDPYDAVPAAADYLCASGAPGDMTAAVFAYNHSNVYVNEVLGLAREYASEYG